MTFMITILIVVSMTKRSAIGSDYDDLSTVGIGRPASLGVGIDRSRRSEWPSLIYV